MRKLIIRQPRVGFIGIEMAENLFLVVLKLLSWKLAVYAEEEFEDKGARLVLGDSVESFEQLTNKITIQLKSGRKISSDMVILASSLDLLQYV